MGEYPFKSTKYLKFYFAIIILHLEYSEPVLLLTKTKNCNNCNKADIK